MADATLDNLMERQRAMSDLAASLVNETDVERIQQVAAELQRMGEELSAMATEVATKAGATSARNFTEVVLTPAQRQRVNDKTGVAIESIVIPDPSGITTRGMPHTDPRIIEYWALREAEKRRIGDEAQAQLRAELDAAIQAIESEGTPAVLEKLAKLKADPNFVGNLVKKPGE